MSLTEKFKKLYEACEVGKTKVGYHFMLNEIEQMLKEYFEACNYEHYDSGFKLGFNSDYRLSVAQQKLEEAKKNPIAGIADAIVYYNGLLSDIISESEKGHLMEFKLVDQGHIECEMYTNLGPRTSYFKENKVSAERHFQEAMQAMRLEGYDLVERNHCGGLFYQMSDNNFTLLTEWLESLGARMIDFTSRDGIIDKISFNLFQKDFEKIKAAACEKTEPVLKTELTEDDVSFVQDCVKEIVSTISMLAKMPSLDNNLAMAVVEGKYADLCKTFSFEGGILQKVTKRHEEERNKNMTARAISEEIGKLVDTTTMMEDFRSIEKLFESEIYSRTSFVVRNLEISHYGQITCRLCWFGEEQIHRFGRGKKCDDTLLNQRFKISDGDRKQRNFNFLDCEENIQAMFVAIREVAPSATISKIVGEINCMYRNITEFHLSIGNFMDLSNLLKTLPPVNEEED